MIETHEPRILWIQQFSCAIRALTMLHEFGLVVGAIDETMIFCVEDGADGKLYTPKLIHAAAGDPAASPASKVQAAAQARNDDVLAAAQAYCRLRLNDQRSKLTNEEQGLLQVKDSETTKLQVLMNLVDCMRKREIMLDNEEKMLEALMANPEIKALTDFVEVELKGLKPWLIWRRAMSLTNTGVDPWIDINLRTQDLRIPLGAMGEYISRPKRRAQRRAREEEIQLDYM